MSDLLSLTPGTIVKVDGKVPTKALWPDGGVLYVDSDNQTKTICVKDKGEIVKDGPSTFTIEHNPGV
jgi:hypothetical protein